MVWILAIFTIASGLAGIVYVFDYFGFIKMKAIQQLVEASPPTTAMSARRPSGKLVLVLLAFTWIAVGLDFYSRATSKNKVDAITSWGMDAGRACGATIDGSLLQEWSSRYLAVIVCGIEDPTVDQFVDERITVSRGFTIVPRAIDIRAPYSKQMSDGLNIWLSQHAVANGQVLEGRFGEWVFLALVPPNTDLDAVRSLVDLHQMGGILLQEKGSTGTAFHMIPSS